MDGRGRIDLSLFNARAEELRGHPRFAQAKERFCTEVPAHWLASPYRRALIADTGALAVSITIAGMHRLDPANGASLQLLIDTLGRDGLASATRIRAMVDMLAHHGAIRIEPHATDRRRLRLVPTGVMRDSHRAWLESVLGAVRLLFDLPPLPQGDALTDLADRYIAGIMLRQAVDRFTIFDGFPEGETFMNRRHGYLLMLQLAGSGGLRTEVNRAHVAQWFGVSSTHIATMLSEAEAKGWLTRRPPSSEVVLDPAFSERLDIWVAREIAIVGMWLQAKLAPKAA